MNQENPKRRRWLLRVAIALVALFALYLCFGVWGVPAIARNLIQDRGSQTLGREVVVRDVEFNPLTLEMQLLGLTVDDPQFEHLLSAERLVVNLQLSSILGRVELALVELEGVHVAVAREADGSFSFQDVLDSLEVAAPEDEGDEDEEPLQARVQRLVGSRLSLRLVDRSLSSGYEETITLDRMFGRNVGTVAERPDPGEDAEQTPSDGPDLIWDVELEGRAQSGARFFAFAGATSVNPWRFHAQASLSDFPVTSLQPFVDEFAVLRVEGRFGAELVAKVELDDPEVLRAEVEGSMELAELVFADDETRYLVAEAFRVGRYQARLPELSISVAEAYLEQPVFMVALDEQGAPVLPSLVESGVGDGSEAGEDGAAAMEGDLSFAIRDSGVRGGSALVEDRSLEEPFTTEISSIELSVSSLEGALSEGSLSLASALALRAEILEGAVTASATLSSLSEPVAFEFGWEGLDLAPMQPYLNAFAQAELQSGQTSGRAQGQLDLEGAVSLNGRAELLELQARDLAEDQPFLSVGRMAMEQAYFSEESGVRIAEILIEGPALRLRRDADGLTVMRIFPEEEAREEPKPDRASPAESETEAEASAPLPFPVIVERFALSDGSVRVADESLVSTFQTRIEEIDVQVSDISTTGDAMAKYEIAASINEGGRFEASGSLDPLDPAAFLDLAFALEGFDLVAASPYMETYLARRLDSGELQLAGRYQTRQGALDGSNDFSIARFDLGERVESDQAMLANLPLGLVIGLLKGPNGVISYNGLAISGDLTQPEVDPWGLVGKAMGGLVTQAASAPFSFLSKMVGGRDDLQGLAFAAGDLSLDVEAQEKARAAARILAQRPALRIELRPVVDEAAEIPGLRRQLLAFRLLYPDREPESLEDLLGADEDPAYREAVAQAYLAAMQEEEYASAEEGSDAEGASATSPQEENQDRERPGLLRRVARFLGFGQGSGEEGEEFEAADTEGAAAIPGDSATEEEIALPDHATMVELLLQEMDENDVPISWLQDIGIRRAEATRQAILSSAELDESRVVIGVPAQPSNRVRNGVTLELDTDPTQV